MSLRWINPQPTARTVRSRWSSAPRVALLTIVTLLMIATSAYETAPSSDPLQAIHHGLDQVIAVFQKTNVSLAARREELRRLAEHNFDFTDMAKSVLGYHWRSLSPEQRSSFVPLFTSFIENAFLSKLQDYTVQRIQQESRVATITYLRESFDGPDYAEVFTDLSIPEQKDPLHVTYLMHRTGGTWRIYDVTIDAISIVGNYRNQFDRVLNNQGYDQLVAIMRAKIQGFREHMEHPQQSS